MSGAVRAVANRYVGLGAALGVPQSALEAMTSLDPKDYLYPQPSAAQQQAALQQLTNQGSMPPGHAAMGSSFGGQGGGYKSGFHPNSAGDPSYTGTRPLDLRWSPDEPVDTGLQGIFNLDLDVDCLTMLAGNELSTASGATSDRSTCTEEARVAAGARSPGSPCATSPSHAAIGAVTAEDDEEAELLVSHSGLGTSFGHLDDALLNMGAFAPLNRTNSMREPRKEGAEKPLKRAKSEGAALTSAPESKPKLRLSLDYEAAAEMINIALADGTGAPAGGHYEHSASETEGANRCSPQKRRREQEV